jgi:hypothetical protein
MPRCVPETLLYACLTHVPLEVRFPDFVQPIHMGDAQGEGRLNLRELAPEWNPFHPVLGSIAGTFALKNLLLQQTRPIQHVGICQYRKFLSRERLGVQAQNYQVMDVLPSAQLAQLDLAGQMLPLGSDFLIGKPGQFALNGEQHGYLYQYKDVHHVEDFLRFTAAAVEVGALGKQEVMPFFDEKIFFPGGIELGVFPTAFWLPHIGAIEAVVRRCVELHDTRRDGTQARIWAFCAERLGSYYLLRYLRSLGGEGGDWLSRHVGQLNLLVGEGEQEYVPGV